MMERKSKASLLLLTPLLAMGCSPSQSVSKPSDNSYCISGGSANNYRCDATASSQAVPMHPQTVDEEWMYETLEDIKDWLEEEKQRRESSGKSP